MTREPDRFDKLAAELDLSGTQRARVAAALRREHDAALDEAAQLVYDEDEGPHGQYSQLGDVSDFRSRCVTGIRALASPAAAPAAETATCVDCKGRGFRGDGHGGRTRCTECDGSGTVPHPAPPSEPAAPAAEPELRRTVHGEEDAVPGEPSEPAAPAPDQREGLQLTVWNGYGANWRWRVWVQGEWIAEGGGKDGPAAAMKAACEWAALNVERFPFDYAASTSPPGAGEGKT